MTEREIQNRIRLALPTLGVTVFRANVGQSWTGDQAIHLANGDVLIKNARPFISGVPPGFSDLFGLTSDGQFVAIEVKAANGRVSTKQSNFLQHIRANRGLAGVARSVEDARKILLGGDNEI